MASYCEPMDVDESEVDKENAFRHNAGAAGGAAGEDLDVSEMNMKLRLSCTPLASPATGRRRFTGSPKKLFPESGDCFSLDTTVISDNANVTLTEFSMGDYNGNSPRSEDSTNSTINSQTEDQNKDTTVLHQSSEDSATFHNHALSNNTTIVLESADNRENTSTPSVPISITTDDTTPTKEVTKTSTSPIMRGLKSVLSMFRPSQSPITSVDVTSSASDDITSAQDVASSNEIIGKENSILKSVLASTPLHGDDKIKKTDQVSLKGSSPLIPDSIVFNEDLINDLHWNDDTTITFNKSKAPGRKLYIPSMRESGSFGSYSRESVQSTELSQDNIEQGIGKDLIEEFAPLTKVADTTVEYMDISMNDSNLYSNAVSQCLADNENQINDLNQTELIKSIVDNVLESVYKSTEKSVYSISMNSNYTENNELVKSIENNDQSCGTTKISQDETHSKGAEDPPDVLKQSTWKITNDCNNFEHINDGDVLKFDSEVQSKSENVPSFLEKTLIKNEALQVESTPSKNSLLTFTANSPEIHGNTDNIEINLKIDNAEEAIESTEIIPDDDILLTNTEVNYDKNINSGMNESKVFLPKSTECTQSPTVAAINKNASVPQQDNTLSLVKETVDEIIDAQESEITETNEIKANGLVIDDVSTEAINVCDDIEIVTSSNNSPYVSLNAPSEQETLNDVPNLNAPELDFNAIENPFATKSRISITPPLSELNFDDTQVLFTSQPRVNLSPVRDTNIECIQKLKTKLTQGLDKGDSIQMTTGIGGTKNDNDKEIILVASDSDNSATNSTNMLDDKLKYNISEIVTLNNEMTVISSRKENLSITDTISGVTTNKNEVVNSIDLHEQSDAYLSADSSGRESEQLLDSELENIYNNHCNGPNEDLQEKTFISATNSQNPFETKSKLRMSPTLQEDSLSTATIIRLSSPSKLKDCERRATNKVETEIGSSPTLENCLSNEIKTCSVPKEQTIIPKNEEMFKNEDENPFQTKTKIRMSPTHVDDTAAFEAPVKDCNNPFAFRAKMCISPPLPLSDCLSQTQEDSIISTEELLLKDVANPFATKSKIRISPPVTPDSKSKDTNILRCADSLSIKNKLKMSPPLHKDLVSNADNILGVHPLKVASGTLENKSEQYDCQANVQDAAGINRTFDLTLDDHKGSHSDSFIDIASKNEHIPAVQSPLNECSEFDVTNSSGSSNLSGHKDYTMKEVKTGDEEVKTEDEDTMEGPDFAGLEPDLTYNPFETPLEIKTSLPVFDKKSQGDGTGLKVILCSDVPTHSSSENEISDQEFVDCTDEQFKPGEMFINADTFDFLMNKNAVNDTNDNGKESLFLKFDPLCAIKRNSTGIVSALPNIEYPDKQRKQPRDIIHEEPTPLDSTITVAPDMNSTQILTPLDSTITVAPDMNSTQILNQTQDYIGGIRDQCSTPPEKPMMAVIPAINNDQVLTPRSASFTPTRPERRSMTFSSPAIAAIDRLISLSGNNSPANHTYYSENHGPSQESNEAILELGELLSEKENQVEQLKAEGRGLQDRLTDLGIQMKSLEEENDERFKKINELQAKLAHKTALNKNMAAVVEEYERVISGMIGENEQEKQRHEQERAALIRERDEQVAHLNSMEVSFSDLHTKYERTKQVILTYKANEDALRKAIEEYKESQQKLETNCEALKQQAVSKLNSVNMELEKMKKSHEAEVLKLTALVKRKEMHAVSLEETLAQKIKANEELTAICDELISKVG